MFEKAEFVPEKVNLLVVDDDRDIRNLFMEIFTIEGYKVTGTGEGVEAIELSKKRFFNVAIIDVKLLDISGIEVLKNIHKSSPETIAIVLTGFASVETAIEAMSEGAYTYLAKPFDIAKVTDMVKKALIKQNLALENIRLSKIIYQRSKQLTRLQDISIEMLSTQDIDIKLQKIVDTTQEFTQSSIVSLMLVDEESGQLRIRRARGVSDEIVDKTALEIGKDIAGWVAEHKESVLVTDIETDERFQRPNREHYKTKSFISIPLILEDKVIGVLNCTDKIDGEVFTNEDLSLLTMVGNQSAVVIHNARLYNRLKIANKELEMLNQLKTDLVSTVSHELRTPLTIIHEGINLAMDPITGEINQTQRECLMIALDGTDRLFRMVSGLLDLSKIEAGRIVLKRDRANVKELVDKLKPLLQKQINKKSLVLKTDVPDNLEDVYIDSDKISQIIINLTGNAVKFTSQGGTITIKAKMLTDVEDKKKREFLQFSVSDTGMGIKEEDLEKIFDKFYRSTESRLKGIEGTGLGLPIAKSLVEAHNGRIWAESEVGKGSTIYFTLPLYHEVEIFKGFFDDSIRRSGKEQTSLAFIILQIKDYDVLKNSLEERVCRELHHEIFKIIKQVVRRPTDWVGKYRGEDMYAILAESNRDGAQSILKRIKNKIREHKFPYKFFDLSFNAGVSIYPDESVEQDELIQKAEQSIVYIGA